MSSRGPSQAGSRQGSRLGSCNGTPAKIEKIETSKAPKVIV